MNVSGTSLRVNGLGTGAGSKRDAVHEQNGHERCRDFCPGALSRTHQKLENSVNADKERK